MSNKNNNITVINYFHQYLYIILYIQSIQKCTISVYDKGEKEQCWVYMIKNPPIDDTYYYHIKFKI